MTPRFYPLIVVQLDDANGGGYAASAPDLEGCTVRGATAEEALHNVAAAVERWCMNAEQSGTAIPAPGTSSARTANEIAAYIARIRELEKLLKDQEEILKEIQEDVVDVKVQMRELEERESRIRSDLDEMMSNPDIGSRIFNKPSLH